MAGLTELKLNDSIKSDFEILFAIPEEKFLALLETLKSVEPGASPQKISEKFYASFEITQNDFTKIVRLIYTIHQIKSSSKFSDEKLIDFFVYSLFKADSKKFSEKQTRTYLIKILELNEIISLTVKTADLSSEREKILRDFDILTDVRPIFEDNELKGMTVIHTLKLEYVENDRDKSIVYLAIDKDDMDNLEKLLRLAKERELSLKSNIPGKFVDLE